ncbi:MAG: riboflavin synthase [Fibrobacterales bacterium]
MFTGIVQRVGVIKKLEKAADSSTFFLETSDDYFQGMDKGASVAVNGVCLTAERMGTDDVKVTAIHQTLDVTNLGDLEQGSAVNLEFPCTASSFLGGHIVMGHIDGVAKVTKIEMMEAGREIYMKFPKDMMKYIISKGSVTLDGTSMTVAEKTDEGIKVAVIPETVDNTRFGHYAVGTRVNFEVDVLGKYIENFLKEQNG